MANRVRLLLDWGGKMYEGKRASTIVQDHFALTMASFRVSSKGPKWKQLVEKFEACRPSKAKLWIIREPRSARAKHSRYVTACRYYGLGLDLRQKKKGRTGSPSVIERAIRNAREAMAEAEVAVPRPSRTRPTPGLIYEPTPEQPGRPEPGPTVGNSFQYQVAYANSTAPADPTTRAAYRTPEGWILERIDPSNDPF